MRAHRNAAYAGLAATTALILAACGSGGLSGKSGSSRTPTGAQTHPLSVLEALDAVQQHTSQAHSAKVESTQVNGALVSITTRGEMDWGHGNAAAVTLTYTGGSAASSMEAVTGSNTITARVVPTGYYINMGPTMARQLGGKEWVWYSYDELAKDAGPAGAYIKDQLQNASPASAVSYILASKNVHKIGTETVRGTSAVHYAGLLDVAAVTRQTSRHLTSSQLAAIQHVLKQAGITTQKIDLWVSAGNLPVEIATSSQTATGILATTTYYSDFGVPVHVQAPPSSDSINASTLLNPQAPAKEGPRL